MVNKAEILDRFVEKLSENSNVLAVIVFGSFARGNSRSDSDIDLIVILNEGYSRTVEVFEDQPFEITYTTEGSAKEYWIQNKHDAAGLWSVGKVIFDREGTGQRLEQFGKELLTQLPQKPDSATLTHLQFDIEDSLRAVEALATTDPSTATLLLHKKMGTLLELYFDLTGAWRPAPKQQIGLIKAADTELGQLIEEFYLTKDFFTQITLAKDIYTKIFSGTIKI